MRVIGKNETVQVEATATSETFRGSFVPSESVSHTSYHELSDKPVQEVDEINQLHTNLELLYSMKTRFSFVMREVRYLLKA
ncbi:hypothetical protein ACLVWU_12870 [Bdellovibrio sp. HCB290]|uniref:hypothetical protein n=1 Tax=Bdellovibrio sp. HCB290 TaxID=3394356 RepID=UPI0039B41676